MAKQDFHAWPELLETGPERMNGADRSGSSALIEARVLEIQSHLAQVDRGVDRLVYQQEEHGRMLTALEVRLKGLEEDIKRFVFVGLAAVLSLAANLLLSRH
jgi:hypothetical protein